MHDVQTLTAPVCGTGTVVLPEAGTPASVKTFGVSERHNRIDTHRSALFFAIEAIYKVLPYLTDSLPGVGIQLATIYVNLKQS
jgi:hypothetical protein